MVYSVKENSEFTIEDFKKKGKTLRLHLAGEHLLERILGITALMQSAADSYGFSCDAEQALFLFVSEISNNALKARGSYQIVNQYKSFEDLLSKEKDAVRIINDTITQNYINTEINLNWKIADNRIEVEIANNTPLTEYFEERINRAIHKCPCITGELIEELESSDTILDTKASGLGMGLSMAVTYAGIVGGSIDYLGDNEGWTSFRLVLKK